MPIGRSYLLGSLAVMVLACDPYAAPPTITDWVQPVTNGTADDSDPAVVAIVFADDPTQVRCTGTAISERVVLTAAHCGAQYDLASFQVFFGADLAGGGSWVDLLDALAHPDFDDTADHDLALLLLAAPAPTTIAPIAEPVVVTPPPVALRLVGFGDSAAGAQDGGRKREGTTRTSEVTDQYVTLEADPSLPCNGDSGGPALATTETGEAIAAVVSRGDASCLSYGKATRVDSHLASFIQPYVDATAPGAVPIGGTCLYPEQCASGLCVTAIDEPLFRFCSQPCADDCADPLTCQDGECRYPLPSPGAVGASCASDDDCLRGECLDDEGWCSVRCVSGRGDCPGGFACSHLGGIDFYCMPEPAGCCAATRSSPSATGSCIVLLFGMLVLVRTRRRDRAGRPKKRKAL